MKKILALVLALVMVLALAACGGGSAAPAEAPAEEAPAEEAPAEAPAAEEAPAGEVTWADYQQYLIDTAGVNAPDPDEFKAQVEAIGSWEDIDQTVSPWDQFFTTLGLSTWEEFQQGIVKELAVMGTASGEGSGEPTEEPAEGEASEEPSGEPSGQMASEFDCEVEVDGETVAAHYEDTDNGDQATKSFQITVGDQVITGAIDKGVWTADNAEDQPIVDQVQAAFEAANPVGPASEEPAAE